MSKNQSSTPKQGTSQFKKLLGGTAGFIKKHKKAIIITIAVIIAAAVGIGVVTNKKGSKKVSSDAQTSTVERGDVEKTITGSAAVEPVERYEIIPLVNGEITEAPYEVGDFVNEGDVLYKFDMSDAELSMQKQQNSMQKSEISRIESKKDLEKLYVTAPCSGIISGMNISVGEEINNNTEVATVSDTQKMKVELPFNAEQIKSISKGQTAVLSSSAHMSSVEGKVTHVSNSPAAQEDGSMLYTVEVVFDNPGAFTSGVRLGGEINGMVSPGGGEAKYYAEGKAKTETEGTVVKVNHSNGDYVSKGDVIITLENETVQNSYRKSELDYADAQIALKEQQEKLDDYIVTAPISGTVITKKSKAGDTIDKTNSSITMMVIADVSKLKFDLEIDELDVNLVSVGQEVEITCDAVEGETFMGYITEMSMEGTATNGVTTYQATVTINEPGKLKPSMNIDATVIIDSVENVLRVPTTDIKTARGKSYVFVKGDGSSSSSTSPDKMTNSKRTPNENSAPTDTGNSDASSPRGNRPNRAQNGDNSAAGDKAEFSREKAASNDKQSDKASENTADKASKSSGTEKSNSGANKSGARSMMPQAPEGFTTVEIEIGLEDDEYTEVKSGLSEGDEIYKQTTASSSSKNMMGTMMGGMPGGPGGGMPGGGAPGGNRSGGGGPR